jgi:hypothetical protein
MTTEMQNTLTQSDEEMAAHILALRNSGRQDEADAAAEAFKASKLKAVAIVSANNKHRTAIDAWAPFFDNAPHAGVLVSGDLLALSIREPVKPRELCAFTTKESYGSVMVYMGQALEGSIFHEHLNELRGVKDRVAIFCDRQSVKTWVAVPIDDLLFVARIIGRASPEKPYRALRKWAFPSHERGWLQATRKHALQIPLQSFGGPALELELVSPVTGERQLH